MRTNQEKIKKKFKKNITNVLAIKKLILVFLFKEISLRPELSSPPRFKSRGGVV